MRQLPGLGPGFGDALMIPVIASATMSDVRHARPANHAAAPAPG
jgi:hypothetical protein